MTSPTTGLEDLVIINLFKRIQGTHVALSIITLLGLALRLMYIDFELPNIYTGFEQHEVMRAVRLGMGSFEFDRVGKGGLFYLLFVEYGFFFLILKFLGIVVSPHDFALYFLRDPSMFWLIGRVTTAVIDIGTVLLVYLLGKKLFDGRVGLTAAFLLAINPLHIRYSHYVIVDVPMVMFSITSIYTMIRISEEGKLKHYLLSGLFIALAAMNKIPAFLLVFPFIFAHWLGNRCEGKGFLIWMDRRLFLGCLAMVAIYIAGEPGIIIHFLDVLKGISKAILGGAAVDQQSLVHSGQLPNLWIFYVKMIRDVLGVPLFGVVVFGFARSFWKPSDGEKLILLFSLVFYIVISMVHHEVWRDRYVMPLIPFGLILASRLIYEAVDRLSRQGFPAALTLGGSLLITAVPCGYLGISQARDFGIPDTRTLAKKWVEENIPAASKVMLHGDPVVTASRTVQIKNLPENLLALAKEFKSDKSGKETYLKMKAKAHEGVAYDLVAVQMRRISLKSVDFYGNEGIEYFILNTRPFIKSEAIKYRGGLYKRRLAFYNELKEHRKAKLIQRFDPRVLAAKGPIIEIYKYSR